VVFQVLLVFGTILGVVIYRMIIVTLLYGVGIDFISTWAKIITSLTASVINLIIILILGLVSYSLICNRVPVCVCARARVCVCACLRVCVRARARANWAASTIRNTVNLLCISILGI